MLQDPESLGRLSCDLGLSHVTSLYCVDGSPHGGMDDLTQLEPPSYCSPQLTGLVSGASQAPATPLSVFYPPNLSKHFKVCVV